MLRTILIYLSQSNWLKHIVMHWAFAWRVASRFIAGETLTDAIQVIQSLNANGINATLDHLGEQTFHEEDAIKATNEIIRIVYAVKDAGICSNLSIKLTQIGLLLDYELCKRNMIQILEVVQETNNFVRIDMEDSSCVEPTLALYKEMHLNRGFRCLGLVIQAYLYRSVDDIARMLEIGTRIRLCKGAYKEASHIAYPKKKDVDDNYDKLARMMMDKELEYSAQMQRKDCKIPPMAALATHDETRIHNAIEYAKTIKLPHNALEFQMLHGIRRDLQDKLVALGYPVRIYVPYGTEWYPYFTRRLAERPANLWFFVINFFRK